MNRLLSISLLGATLLFFCGSTRAEWHRFRGPDGNGYISGSKELPPELGENTLAWKATLPGRGLGSPIVIGDRVILSAASGPHQDKLQILCFSNQDGSELWRRSFWATGRTMCH